MKMIRYLSAGSNKNRPGGRLRSAKIIFNSRGEIMAFKNPMPPSQGRGQDGKDDTTSDYTPIVNEPRTNSVIVREQLKAKLGVNMPVPETRQARHEREKQQRQLDYVDARIAYDLTAANRKAREKHPHSTRATRRRKHEEQFNG